MGQRVDLSADYEYTPLGELQHAQDDVSEYDYTFDSGRNVQKEVQTLAPLDNQAVDFIYGRNLLGQITGLTANLPDAADNFANTYAYDNRGRMAWVSQSGTQGGSNVLDKASSSTTNTGRWATARRTSRR